MTRDLNQSLNIALNLTNQGKFFEAESLYAQLLQQFPQHHEIMLLMVGLKFALKKNSEAITLYNKILSIRPNYQEAHLFMAQITQPGEDYIAILKHLHQWLKPQSYMEIGVETGQSLSLALNDTHAIGVDPSLQIRFPLSPMTQTYEMTSDDFFAGYDLLREIKTEKLDLVFIDGLHFFEQVIKDFINVEKYASPNTVILIHDCFPLDKATSDRERKTQFWSGDTWKTILILEKYRPDLNVFTVLASPTGLGVVTNADPESTILSDKYEEIVQTYMAIDYSYIEIKKEKMLKAIPSDWQLIKQKLHHLKI